MTTDFEQLENLRQWRFSVSNGDSVALIAVYVPESDVLSFEDALALALRRDEQAAYELRTWQRDEGLAELARIVANIDKGIQEDYGSQSRSH